MLARGTDADAFLGAIRGTGAHHTLNLDHFGSEKSKYERAYITSRHQFLQEGDTILVGECSDILRVVIRANVDIGQFSQS